MTIRFVKFFCVKGAKYFQKAQSISKCSFHHFAAVVDLLKDMTMKITHLRLRDVRIACGYSAQCKTYVKALEQLDKEHPDEGWLRIRVRTAEGWQGGENHLMIVDLTRGANDNGFIGFVRNKKRFNALLSRQKQAYIIVGNPDSINVNLTANLPVQNPDDGEEKKRKDNQWMIKVFEFCIGRGRLVTLDSSSLSETYVTFPVEEASTVFGKCGRRCGRTFRKPRQ